MINKNYCDIGEILYKGSTDKNTTHRYGISYDLIFNSQYLKQNRPLRILEIGISLFGDGSVGSLSEIDYIEKYVGLDIKPYNGMYPNDKITIYAGPEYDAYKLEMINMLQEKEGKFDIIIDDGPHTWESQQWFFENYYSLLNEGGVLLCEDIHGQHYNQLQQLSKKLKLYILDLRMNNNPNGDEIIALRYKNKIKKNAIVIPVYNSLQENEQYKKCISTWEYYCEKHNIELHLIKGEKYFTDFPDYAAMCFDRWTDINFPTSEYDRITFVDADTLVRWDMLDINQIFDDNGLDIVVVPDQGGDHIAKYHVNQWLGFKSNASNIVKNYFNAGFVSMKSHHFSRLQQQIGLYKDYYYTCKDIEGHVKGIGVKDGVRIDAMDQTAINIILQELFPHNITFISKEFNCQVPYLFKGDEDFRNNYSSFEFLNEGYIFHLGSSTLAHTDLVNEFYNNFKEYYI
jgi:hypothetical protein